MEPWESLSCINSGSFGIRNSMYSFLEVGLSWFKFFGNKRRRSSTLLLETFSNSQVFYEKKAKQYWSFILPLILSSLTFHHYFINILCYRGPNEVVLEALESTTFKKRSGANLEDLGLKLSLDLSKRGKYIELLSGNRTLVWFASNASWNRMGWFLVQLVVL